MEKTQWGTLDPRDYRNAMGRFATGITVVTTINEGKTHGMTANAFCSVSLEPPLVLLALDNRTKIKGVLCEEGQKYGISVLSQNQKEVSNHFAGKEQEGLEIDWVERHGIPLLEGAVTHLVCKVYALHPAGDHTLCIGEVEYLDYKEGEPLLFYTGNYSQREVWEDTFFW